MLHVGVQVRYRDDLDLVLKGLNLDIKPREKIGIVGRTGCGKSTLMSTLFRIVEPTAGRVLIDGQDLAHVPLHHLRSKLALVPQVGHPRSSPLAPLPPPHPPFPCPVPRCPPRTCPPSSSAQQVGLGTSGG